MVVKRISAVVAASALLVGTLAGAAQAAPVTASASTTYGVMPRDSSVQSSFSSIRQLEVLPDGKMLVANASDQKIYRLNVNGSVDLSFNAPKLSHTPEMIEVLSNGKFIAGGSFLTVNGIARERAAMFNSNGTLDTASGLGVANNFGATGRVDGFLQQANGSFYLFGAFQRVFQNGVDNQRRYVAKFTADGNLDPSFQNTNSGTGLPVINSGGPTCGGTDCAFSGIDGPNGSVIVGISYGRGIESLQSNGLRNPAFNPGGTGTSGAAREYRVVSIIRMSDGRIAIAGRFLKYNDVPRPGIAVLKPDGTLDTSFSPRITNANDMGNYTSLIQLADGRLAAVRANFINSPFDRVEVFRLDGSLDDQSRGGTFDKSPYDLASPGGSNIWAVGDFSMYDGRSSGPLVKLSTAPGSSVITPPRIAGNPALGGSAAFTDAEFSPSGTKSYRWLLDGTPIPNAIGTSLPITDPSWVDKSLAVEVTNASADRPTTTAVSDSIVIGSGKLLVASGPTFSGTPKVGVQLTVSPGTVTPAPTSITYQWYQQVAGGQADIAGATSSQYTPVVRDWAETLGVRVTYKRDGYNDQVLYLTAGEVGPGVLTTGKTTISGSFNTPGSVLAANTPSFAVTPDSVSYQWYAGGAKITTATSRTFTLSAAQNGQMISVQATAKATGYADWTDMSQSVGPVSGYFTAQPPAVSGNPKVGNTLSINRSGVFTPTPTTVTVAWLADGQTIAGATGDTLALTGAMEGKRITARLTAASSGVQSLSVETNPTVAVAKGDPVTIIGKPLISGAVKVGEQVSITTSAMTTNPSGATYAYQWNADGTPIPGMQSSQLALLPYMLDKNLSVTITATLAGYATSTVTSDAIKVVKGALAQSVASSLKAGTPKVGVPSSFQVVGVTTPTSSASVEWTSNGTPIPGATSSTYTPSAAMAGTQLAAKVTHRVVGYEDRVETLTAGTVAKGTLAANTAKPSISGNPSTAGATLTASAPALAASSTLSYIWKADGSPIGGATSSTFITTSAQNGKRLTVTVTATAAGYEDWTGTSDPVGPVAGYFSVATTPTISGTAKVDQTLSVNTSGVFTPAPTQVDVQWVANGVALAGKTGTTLALTPGLAGKSITAKLTASAVGHQDLDVTTAPTAAVANAQFASTGNIEILGRVGVGEAVAMGSEGVVLTPDPDDVTIQWKLDGQDIPGATGFNFDVTLPMFGKQLTVTATAIKDGYDPLTYTSDSIKVAPGYFGVTAEPTVSGAVKVGETVTYSPGTTNPPSRVTYQWRIDDEPIAGAASASYTPVAGNVGKKLSLVATYAQTGFEDREVIRDLGPVAAGVLTTGTPRITGQPHIGYELAVQLPTFAATPSPVNYAWFADGAPISGATASKLMLTAAQAKKNITVQVSARAAGYDNWTGTSPAVGPVAGYFTAQPPAITGNAVVGQTLTVSRSGVFFPTPEQVAVEWLANGQPISGATNDSLVLRAAERGKTITARLTATAANFETLSVTTDPTAAVADGALAVTGRPSITGTVAVGQRVSASTSSMTSDPSGATYTYQWLLDGQAVAGATAAQFDITQPMYDKRLSVTATASLNGYAPAKATSNESQVRLGTLTQQLSTQVQSSPRVGRSTSVIIGGTTSPSSMLAYQWLRNGSPIAGATGISFTPTAAMAGDTLAVRATHSTNGYQNLVQDIESGTIAKGFLAAAGSLPTISGRPDTAGKTLTAGLPQFDVQPVSVSYQWLADGVDIDGATGSTLVTTSALKGKNLSLFVRATGPAGYLDWSGTSAEVGPVDGYFGVATAAEIVGDAKVGDILVVDASWVFTPKPDTVSYRWFSDGRILSRETGPSLTLLGEYAGTEITVQLTAEAAGHEPLAVNSDPTEPVANAEFVTTGSLAIGGTPTVGSTVQAAGDLATFPADVNQTWQWRLDGADVVGATGDEFQIQPQHVGKDLSLQVTISAIGYDPIVLESDPVAIAAGTLVADDEPSFAGRNRVGGTVTATAGTTAPTSTASFQWLIDGTPVDGATGEDYSPVAADAGAALSVEITHRAAGYEDLMVPMAIGEVGAGVLGTGVPTISGSTFAGATLTANLPTLAATPKVTTYEWLADGVAIAGASNRTLVLRAEQIGARITVRATAEADGYGPWEGLSTSVGPVSNYFSGRPVTISGTPQVGLVLTIDPSQVFTPAPDSVGLQWLVDGVALSGATSDSLVVPASALAKRISVALTATKAGLEPLSMTTAATSAVAAGEMQATGKPTVSGTPKVGSLLTADTSAVATTPQATAFTYRWSVAGRDIPGATESTLLLTREEYLGDVTVTVEPQLTGYVSPMRTSEATADVAGADFVTGPATLDRDPQVGAQVGVNHVDAFDPMPARVLYQWLLDGKAIEGATSTTYTPSSAQVGKKLSARLTATLPGLEQATVVSDEIQVFDAPITPSSCTLKTGLRWVPSAKWAKKKYLVKTGKTVKVPFAVSPTGTRQIAVQFRIGKGAWTTHKVVTTNVDGKGKAPVLGKAAPKKKATITWRLLDQSTNADSSTLTYKVKKTTKKATGVLAANKLVTVDECRAATSATWKPSKKLKKSGNKIKAGKKAKVAFAVAPAAARPVEVQLKQGKLWSLYAMATTAANGKGSVKLTGIKPKAQWRLVVPESNSGLAKISKPLKTKSK